MPSIPVARTLCLLASSIAGEHAGDSSLTDWVARTVTARFGDLSSHEVRTMASLVDTAKPGSHLFDALATTRDITTLVRLAKKDGVTEEQLVELLERSHWAASIVGTACRYTGLSDELYRQLLAKGGVDAAQALLADSSASTPILIEAARIYGCVHGKSGSPSVGTPRDPDRVLWGLPGQVVRAAWAAAGSRLDQFVLGRFEVTARDLDNVDLRLDIESPLLNQRADRARRVLALLQHQPDMTIELRNKFIRQATDIGITGVALPPPDTVGHDSTRLAVLRGDDPWGGSDAEIDEASDRGYDRLAEQIVRRFPVSWQKMRQHTSQLSNPARVTSLARENPRDVDMFAYFLGTLACGENVWQFVAEDLVETVLRRAVSVALETREAAPSTLLRHPQLPVDTLGHFRLIDIAESGNASALANVHRRIQQVCRNDAEFTALSTLAENHDGTFNDLMQAVEGLLR